ncbi:hypothetical protein AXF42_Ash018864 [Apostasia shenzhenica]|uniref:Uncharacterized protein n=1 Tax=Apostasia shenzhenica TaxID=1088818 RepID=A0A2I0B4Z6_9ASPA|nr:hypothetical protein AXF42_Ash018864 [Apostasia shenzhenica]
MLFSDPQIKDPHALVVTDPEVVLILKVSILLLLLLVPPAANKLHKLRAYLPPFLRKTRIKLHHSLPTNTP